MNRGFQEATHKLALTAASVWRQHLLMHPPAGAGPTFQHPVSAQLLALVVEGATNSLVSRIDLWARPRATTSGGGEHETRIFSWGQPVQRDYIKRPGEPGAGWRKPPSAAPALRHPERCLRLRVAGPALPPRRLPFCA